MSKNSFPKLLHAWVALSALFGAGCAQPSKPPTEKAEKAVEQFLDGWSRGVPPDTFAASDQPIQGSDPDWQAGYRLLSFLTDDATQSQETPSHFRCRVALSLQDPRGRKLDKQVLYDVQMGEKIVISRVSSLAAGR